MTGGTAKKQGRKAEKAPGTDLTGGRKAEKSTGVNYILEYYQAICDGSEIVGTWIREWYEYIIRGLENKEFYFSAKKANLAIRFFESYCHHHEGALAPQLIKLELWQKAMLSVIYGIVTEEGTRQFVEDVIVIGRKNGKTLIAGGMGIYTLFVEPDYGKRVFTCAPKLDQARLCYDAMYQMILKEPEMSRMTKKRRTDLYIQETNSSAQPIAFSDKKSDGLNPSLAVCDEGGAWQGERGLKMYEVLRSALGARTQPQLVTITTAGYQAEGIYDELIRRGTAVIKGTSREKRLAPFLYMIDDVEKWNDLNEIKKANPNLGVSVSVGYMLEEIAIAEGSISKKMEFLTKYCNRQQNASTAWFSAEMVNAMYESDGVENRYTLDDFRDTYCLLGVDLSQTTDLTSAVALIQRAGIIWIFAHFWLPADKIQDATDRDGIPYQIMIEKGYLSPSGNAFVDYKDVFSWCTSLVEEYKIYPLQIGYDRYSSQYLVQDLEGYGFHMESVSQGFNLSGISDNLEGLMKNGQIKSAEDNGLLKIHLMDAALQLESNVSVHPRKKLVKVSKNAHVDGVAAILDALCMRQVHWAELGEQLKNED